MNKINDSKLEKVSGGYYGLMDDDQNAMIDNGTCPFCGKSLTKTYWEEAGHKSSMWSMNCPSGHEFIQDVNTKKWASLV